MHRTLILLHGLLWVTPIRALEQHGAGVREAGRQDLIEDTILEKPSGFITFPLIRKPARFDESLAKKLARGAEGSSSPTGERHPTRTTRKNAILTDRDNTHQIVTASDPSISNAAGVQQDGTDFSYFVEAELGSKKKPIYMLIDTGASTTWVMGADCTSTACSSHNTFGLEDSDTYVDTGNGYSVKYGTGNVTGHLVADSMSIAGLSVSFSFGVANYTSDEFITFPFDGILGLSLASNTWLSGVRNASLAESNVFGVSLARNEDGVNDGEIAFGGPNPAKFQGDISYTPINQGSTWTIPFEDITVGDKPAGINGRSAYIDTGTSFIFGPPEDVEALYRLIPGSSPSGEWKYTVPCDSDASIAFAISGRSWAISSKDLISGPDGDGNCTGNIYGLEYVPDAWLLGDSFLKNVYSVFDPDQARIGFAAKAPPSTPQGSSTQSTGMPSMTSTPVTQLPDSAPSDTGTPDPTGPTGAGNRLVAAKRTAAVLCICAVVGVMI